jgi:hypothetical protein
MRFSQLLEVPWECMGVDGGSCAAVVVQWVQVQGGLLLVVRRGRICAVGRLTQARTPHQHPSRSRTRA